MIKRIYRRLANLTLNCLAIIDIKSILVTLKYCIKTYITIT